jgi:hypothetical protein
MDLSSVSRPDPLVELQQLQAEVEALAAAKAQERRVKETNFNHICQNIFKRRRDVVIRGNSAQTPALSAGVPRFWLTAMMNSTVAGFSIEEHDMSALEHLIDVRVEYADDFKVCGSCILPLVPSMFVNMQSWKIIFEFSPNEWFDNRLLTSTVELSDDLLSEGNLAITKLTGYNSADGIWSLHLALSAVTQVCH